MVNLTWLNIDFVRVLELAAEFGRVVIALDFRPPPPEYTFRALEPIYKQSIEHFEQRCEQKAREISAHGKSEKDAEDGIDDVLPNEQRFDDLEDLLHKHSRLISSLSTLLAHPHLHPLPHSATILDTASATDTTLGRERYIDPPTKGYGFSNDYIRQWLAAIPGRAGRHFEAEEAARTNLTAMAQRVVVALVGGAALLVPMVVMTFETGRTGMLVVVCVATILFGVAFALVSKSKENVLAGTAAYAAVMVVYIGSASPDGS
ncbi:hypothetical protein LTR09_009626 [Extremus antarcticus]|uniref:DUF6594 domain-containing protein n=1 Tax=Extremus antarcticus TaxID=702011 RepID=A0AAJ0DF89_9PEZI|nr:hypothetical protein LTR09_009626 [Extremus antarcticus]